MAFKKLEPPAYPRRLWTLAGYPGCGKSTFAARLRGPLLVVDADHRFDEVARLASGDVYRLSDTASDNVLAERIAACLAADMPGSPIHTIVVDSLTAIMAPLVTRALLANAAGRHKNRAAAFMDKALSLRLLQDVIGAWGTDVLYIYHLQDGRDAHGQAQTTATVSPTELARLQRSINVQLRITQEGERRAIHVDWARHGRCGMRLVDESGAWRGMPERIEEAIYGGLSQAGQDQNEAAAPASFAGPEQALAWGLAQGCFRDLPHARQAYDRLKAEHRPAAAAEMWALWRAEVTARKAAGSPGEV